MIKHILTFALLLSAGVAAAQSLPPGVPAPPLPPPSAPQSPDPTAITPDQLGWMLVDLGYEPKDISGGKKSNYSIVTERDGWKIFITVSLSPSRHLLWFNVNFTAIDNLAAAPPAAWLKLLELTGQHQPIHFTLNAKSEINLWLGVPNTGLDASFIREELENFDDVVRKTVPYWRREAFAGK